MDLRTSLLGSLAAAGAGPKCLKLLSVPEARMGASPSAGAWGARPLLGMKPAARACFTRPTKIAISLSRCLICMKPDCQHHAVAARNGCCSDWLRTDLLSCQVTWDTRTMLTFKASGTQGMNWSCHVWRLPGDSELQILPQQQLQHSYAPTQHQDHRHEPQLGQVGDGWKPPPASQTHRHADTRASPGACKTYPC